jgi:hypothetical protein
LPLLAAAQVIEFGRPAPPIPAVVDRNELDDAGSVNGNGSASTARRAKKIAGQTAESRLEANEETGFDLTAKAPKAPMIQLERIWIEAGILTQDRSQVDTSNYLRSDLAAEWGLSSEWSLRLAGRLDGSTQSGVEDFNRLELDYGESYLRYQGENRRITLGTQIVNWGRVDETPPTDRLSVQDISRLLLDDLEDRRRAVLAIRWEEFIGEFKLDLQYLPRFRPGETPRLDSIWSPVDKHSGRLIGVPFSALLAPLIQLGRFNDDADGDGGWGVRLSRPGRGFDYAVTVQQARQSLPYFALDPRVRAKFLADPVDIGASLSAAKDTFVARYPRTWVVGGDLGLVTERATWRFEAAWLSDQSATTADLRYVNLEAIDWVAGVEFYPGDREVRMNLQLGGSQLLDAPSGLIDRQKALNLFGDMESAFGRDRWRARLRFFAGLNERDRYLNPRIAFLGWEPHELYVAYHYFEGSDQTLGGFYRRNDLVTLGLRAKF